MQAKIKYYEWLFARKVWNEVRDLTSTKRQNTEINIKTATGVLTGREAAAALNEYFVSSTQLPDRGEPMATSIVHKFTLTNLVILTPAEVVQLLLKVKKTTSLLGMIMLNQYQ